MRERVVTIGRQKPLIGVLCDPGNTSAKTDAEATVTDPNSGEKSKVAVLLLNSGVMHRVGSCRMSVNISRALCRQAGVSSFRFDFSGIGDSPARRGGSGDIIQTAVTEVKEVMDYLQQKYKFESFILYGLCSGAFTSFQVAIADDRIKGIAQVDGYSYPTPKSYFYYYLPRVLSVSRWQSLFSRVLLRTNNTGAADQSGAAFMEVPNFESFPPKSTVEQWLALMMSKHISIYSIFTGKEPGYSYQGQYEDCFSSVDFSGRLRLLHLSEASHILTEPQAQSQVIEGVVSWVDDFFVGNA